MNNQDANWRNMVIGISVTIVLFITSIMAVVIRRKKVSNAEREKTTANQGNYLRNP